jgi:hypothetical protein
LALGIPSSKKKTNNSDDDEPREPRDNHLIDDGDFEDYDGDIVSDKANGPLQPYYERIRPLVDRNDPRLVYVEILGEFTPPDGNWEGFGESIGRNTHLRELVVAKLDEAFNDFSRGIALNQSIKKLRSMDVKT